MDVLRLCVFSYIAADRRQPTTHTTLYCQPNFVNLIEITGAISKSSILSTIAPPHRHTSPTFNNVSHAHICGMALRQSLRSCIFRFTYQLTFWDQFKRWDGVSTRKVTNLAQMLAHLFSKFALSLTVLKVLSEKEEEEDDDDNNCGDMCWVDILWSPRSTIRLLNGKNFQKRACYSSTHSSGTTNP